MRWGAFGRALLTGIQIQPGDIEVVSVASTVANGQVVSYPVGLFVVLGVWIMLTVVCRSGSSSRLATMLEVCLVCAVGWMTRHGDRMGFWF